MAKLFRGAAAVAGCALTLTLIAGAAEAGRLKGAPAAGAVDLSGEWTNAWYTQLERPKGFKALVATPAEAEAYEAPRRALRGEIVDAHDKLGQATSEFPDNGPGLARIGGQIRSSWIVDPADGKVPWTKAARVRLGLDGPPSEKYDNIEERDTDERCLTAPGGQVPLLNSHDANVLEIVQTPGWLIIVSEKNHMTRIVPLDGRPASPADLAAGRANWSGVSVGRVEGRSIVIRTTGFRPGLTRASDDVTLSDKAVVTERLTRTGPTEITYAFQVEDPELLTRPWRGEMVFRPAEGRMFEYACHEGNYALTSILSAARQSDAAAAAKP